MQSADDYYERQRLAIEEQADRRDAAHDAAYNEIYTELMSGREFHTGSATIGDSAIVEHLSPAALRQVANLLDAGQHEQANHLLKSELSAACHEVAIANAQDYAAVLLRADGW
jgi:hypothetical protein